MNYKTISQKELNESRLLPAGIYDFEIHEAKETTSKKSGRPMLQVSLRIFQGEGFRKLLHNIMLDNDQYGTLRGLSSAIGLLDAYESMTLNPADMAGRAGQLKLKVKFNEEMGEEQNQVSYYITPKKSDAPAPRQVAKPEPAKEDDDSDSVPF